ncbi:MAG: hypothetical protein LBS19_13045 [Clostridiales bacterium]|jgi:hypothetical protein|nr:hypothetical protein [Clostridiales bacterium]
MDNLLENLSDFLKECINDASSSLYLDERYIESRDRRDELLRQLESAIGPENTALLTRYTETLTVIHGMDSYTIFLCGLTLIGKIKRFFEAATPEYRAFMEKFVC